MGLLVDEDKIVKQLKPELQRLVNAIVRWMVALTWATIICAAVFVFRQMMEEKESKTAPFQTHGTQCRERNIKYITASKFLTVALRSVEYCSTLSYVVPASVEPNRTQTS